MHARVCFTKAPFNSYCQRNCRSKCHKSGCFCHVRCRESRSRASADTSITTTTYWSIDSTTSRWRCYSTKWCSKHSPCSAEAPAVSNAHVQIQLQTRLVGMLSDVWRSVGLQFSPMEQSGSSVVERRVCVVKLNQLRLNLCRYFWPFDWRGQLCID